MPKEKEIHDSPRPWVANHISEYVKSDGKKGHQWHGYPTLLLTTKGRKTGELRRTALIYGQDGEDYLLVASNGGAQKHPLWYLNLVDEPKVEIQVGPETIKGRARTAGGKERARLWKIMTKVYPTYDRYQAKCKRQIPLIVIEPKSMSKKGHPE